MDSARKPVGQDDLPAVNNCDGCNQPMDFIQYQNHECIAYRNHKYKNPFMHKSSVATWKTPKGKVVARGTCLTKEDIAMVTKRGPEAITAWSNISASFRKRKKSIGIVVVLVIVVLLVNYG